MAINRQDIAKFITDPEFHFIEEMLLDYLKPLTDLNTIDTKQDPATVKAEIIVRKQMIDRLNLFLTEIGLLKGVLSREEKSYK